jgi:chromate transporter
MLFTNLQRLRAESLKGIFIPPLLEINSLSINAALSVPYNLTILFLTFLKIGAILYGSGYVLFAFLHADFVTRLGWLTDQQLIDAIAVGQVTPGPLFTSATFIGYILGGVPGSLLATLGIFLPSFVFVAISNPLIPKMRNSIWVGSFLDGINIASLSLMTAVTFQLGQASLIDLPTILISVITLGLLLRFKLNSTWLIAGGAAAGLLISVIR